MKIIFSILFTFVFLCDLASASELIPFRLGNKWGYADTNLQIIIPPKYKAVGEFLGQITWVKKGRKYAFINKQGELVTKFKFDFADEHNRATLDGKNVCLNDNGEIIRCIPRCGSSTIRKVCLLHNYDVYLDNKKIGIIKFNRSRSGRNKLPYDTIPPIFDEFKKGNRWSFLKKDNKWCVLNVSGEFETECSYDDIEENKDVKNPSRFRLIIKNDEKFGFLDSYLKEIVRPQYYKVDFSISENLAKVWINKRIWFYIDLNGREYYRKKRKRPTTKTKIKLGI